MMRFVDVWAAGASKKGRWVWQVRYSKCPAKQGPLAIRAYLGETRREWMRWAKQTGVGRRCCEQ